MINNFLTFPILLEKETIKIKNNELNKILTKIHFFQLNQPLDLNNQNLIQNFKNSKVAVIDQCPCESKTSEETLYLLCFKETLVLFPHPILNFLQNLFNTNTDTNIYCLSSLNDFIFQNKEIKNKIIQSDQFLIEEIANFCKVFNITTFPGSSTKEVWRIIQRSIAGYLIKDSYSKTKEDRYKKFYNFMSKCPLEIKKYDNDNFIELRDICNTNTSKVSLVYNIETEELMIIKKIRNNTENCILFYREFDNYVDLGHPLFPILHGINEKEQYLVIEYVNGRTLLSIKELHLDESDKITIIFQLLILFIFLFENGFVYRDLKPNNVMIDEKL